MRYFLDTNICIYALKNKFPRIKEIMETLSPLDIAIPSNEFTRIKDLIIEDWTG